jgi:superfamily I DNA and/or RNA helicase
MEFLYSLNRLNVATLRAQAVVIVVGSPRLRLDVATWRDSVIGLAEPGRRESRQLAIQKSIAWP